MKPERKMLQAIFDDIFEVAKKIVEVDRQQHRRILLLYAASKKLVVKVDQIPLTGDMDIDGQILKFAASSAPEDAVLVLVDEIWMKYVAENETPDLTKGVEQIPGRKEGVIFSFFGRDWQNVAFCEIKRAPLKLLKGELLENITSEGRLSPSP